MSEATKEAEKLEDLLQTLEGAARGACDLDAWQWDAADMMRTLAEPALCIKRTKQEREMTTPQAGPRGAKCALWALFGTLHSFVGRCS